MYDPLTIQLSISFAIPWHRNGDDISNVYFSTTVGSDQVELGGEGCVAGKGIKFGTFLFEI